MANIAFPAVPIEGGLARYFREVWQFPILEREEEQALAIQWRDKEDVDAAHKLVTSHLRLVCKIAMGYKGYGLPMADLVSEGNIGLMKAVKKFDPGKGCRLSTYAMWWIKAAITEHILKSWSLVKLGTVASQKKLFFSLRSIKARLGVTDGGELSDENAQLVSEQTDVSVSDVINMNRRLGSRDMSLNAPISQEEETATFQDTLVSDGPSPEAALADVEEFGYRNTILKKALQDLPKREREIFIERRLSEEPQTLEELGSVYGISRERVRQLEARAFDKIRKTVRAEADALGLALEAS
ncbi:MAG: RNA polymerase factor sigma-32 [Rhodospirillaceae bacterium TMED8]|nr:RNA polymerase sigma factor RpoH [Magnetovibrio sp.]OUT50266.1 MAG: RNA polymerase factor sigma-32 [Rhodospirillaceae bacterium TMED8]|tara:strand:- start:3513 stop:4406 length:894 start_codon:yes stop_codon:yes gene_type:complete